MIGATSLRTNSTQSFGKTPKKGEAKENKTASKIATAVGATGAAAVGAYAFRGKIGNSAFAKKAMSLFTKIGEKLVEWGTKALNYIRETKIGKKVEELGTRFVESIKTRGVKETFKTVGRKIKEHFSKK